MDSSAVLMVRAGDHWSFRMSCGGSERAREVRAALLAPLARSCCGVARTRQIAPVCDEMLGCQIFVWNFIFGGSNG